MHRWLPAILVPLLGCAASDTPPSPWREAREPELTPDQRAQLAAATAAREELASALLHELTEALLEGDPASAISVCKDVAPRLAREVGARAGLELGRTSFRLRNPANAPPAWAAALVERRVEEPRVLVSDDGRLAALAPIRVAPPCLACHGAADSLDPAVRAALAASYPDDRATGFAEGDLRGWFWALVPAASERR